MYTLRFAKSAEKVIARMPQGVARRMIDELKAIAADPTMYRGDWKPLSGSSFWRLFFFFCFFFFDLCYAELVVLVVKVAPRGDAYK